MSSRDQVAVNVELRTFIPFYISQRTSFLGKFSSYEETYDSTGAGFYKFRKDVAQSLNLESDDFLLEVKDGNHYYNVYNGPSFDQYLNKARRTQNLDIRVRVLGKMLN